MTSSPSSPFENPLRPAELARNYIEREFLSGDRGETRLPTIEQLARHLDISPSTVRAVVRKLAAEGRLQTTQGRGTFVKRGEKGVTKKDVERPLRLATNRFRLDPERVPDWIETIYLGAVGMAAKMRRNLSVMPVVPSVPEFGAGEVHEELLRQIDQIDMLMLFPFAGHDAVRQAYEEAGKPVVEINPPAVNATLNFVSADFFGTACRLGRAWYEAGRRNFLFIGPLEGSVSMQLYRMGFAVGARRDCDPGVRFQAIHADNFEPDLSSRRLLGEGESLPDAIFCSGDFVGMRTLAILQKMGVDVPGDVSLAAGTGFAASRFSDRDLTRVVQPMDQIGANAVRVLCHRLDNQNAAVPGLYLSTPIHCGNTTRGAENERLGKPPENDRPGK